MKPNPTQEPDAADELLSLGKRLCCLVWRLIWTFCKWMLENVLIFIACLLALAFGPLGLLVAQLAFLGPPAEKKPGDADEKQDPTPKTPAPNARQAGLKAHTGSRPHQSEKNHEAKRKGSKRMARTQTARPDACRKAAPNHWGLFQVDMAHRDYEIGRASCRERV